MPNRLEQRERAPSGRVEGCVITLHGRGTTGEDLMPLADEIALPGIHWIFPDAPFPFSDDFGGRMWYSSPPQGQSGILESRRLLFDLLDRLITREGIPSDRIALTGFSQGAVMSLDVGLRYPQPLAAIIALSGYLASPETLAAEKSPASIKTPILLVHGTMDEVVPVDGSRKAHMVLVREGYQPRLEEYPMGHQVIPEEIQLIGDFLKTQLRIS
ncbi:MAG: dienelactone hydrolase family protein [Candidatus Manganitrophus sp.]|nr:dienelactone hydrolase family protein [Candidatus Manganitrophus sp.]WDT72939.1 MAG: dienelactone hydrolase family protein [Candidatus Manganitrophus sp.]WDT79546.1 MAG: dienelactone hydrolase family protein [Candidatus Manganitrophus sp.]